MSESKTIMVTRTYLAELGAALTGVPAEVREGILNGVREELDGLDATEAGRRIQELGDPQFIAAEARSEASGPAAKIVGSVRDTRSYAIVAAVLVMVGGFVIPGLGAIAGLVLVWFAHAWTRAEKWIATLIPFAVMALTALVGTIVSLQTAQQPPADGGEALNPLIPAYFDVVTLGIVLVLLVHVAVGIWLLVRARPTRVHAESE